MVQATFRLLRKFQMSVETEKFSVDTLGNMEYVSYAGVLPRDMLLPGNRNFDLQCADAQLCLRSARTQPGCRP